MLVLLVATRPCAAQTAPAPGAFVEFAGDALLGMSLHAEMPVRANLLVRAGVGVDFFSYTTVLPVQVVLLTGRGNSKLELAAGITVANEPTQYSGNWHWNGTRVFPSGFLGYRYERSSGILFRIGVIPLFWTNAHIPWLAVGIGRAF